MSSLLHVVLAAHGAGNGSASNLRVSACAERLAMAVPEIEVTAAFHLGSPTLPEVLEQTPSRDFLVIPMLTTDGYFARRIRQQVFACSARGCRPTVHAPIGTHPALIDLMLKDLREILDKRDPMDRPFEILVIGHGTKRHQRSRHATSHVALRLARETPSVVRAAFLDDAPTVEETLERIAPATTLLVVPFLFGGGSHAEADLPDRVQKAWRRRGGDPVRLEYLRPLGWYSAIDQILIDMVSAHHGRPFHFTSMSQ